MKKYIESLIVVLFLISISLFTPAQPPFNPPNPYSNGNGQGISGGGLHNTGAPIDGGLGIMLIFAAGFGIRKAYRICQKEPEKK